MTQWDEDPNGLWLLTPDEYHQLPMGTELESIMGNRRVKSDKAVDQDIRFGHLAWGVRDPHNHPQRHLLLTFLLKGQPA